MDACGAGTYWDEESQACLTTVTCAEDLNTDGIVGIADLLQLLSMFGTPCDEVETSEFTLRRSDELSRLRLRHGADWRAVLVCGEFEDGVVQQWDSIPGELSSSEWNESLYTSRCSSDSDNNLAIPN